MAITMIKLNIPYPRPQIMSDPHNDFGGPSGTTKYLGKKDNEMIDQDFKRMFQMFLPMGTYEEMAYFIPVVLNYITKETDDPVEHELCCDEFWDGFFAFFRANHKMMLKDGIAEQLLCAFTLCLEKLTSQFVILDISSNKKLYTNWYVKNNGILIQLLESLMGMEYYRKIACDFIQRHSIAHNDSINSAWYLICVINHHCLKEESLKHLFQDKDLIQAHIETTKSLSQSQPCPFWGKFYTYLSSGSYLDYSWDKVRELYM